MRCGAFDISSITGPAGRQRTVGKVIGNMAADTAVLTQRARVRDTAGYGNQTGEIDVDHDWGVKSVDEIADRVRQHLAEKEG